MKLNYVLLPAGAIFLASYLVPTTDTQAFVTNGASLVLNQRDVRVFNNFTDPEANNNNVEHPNWPGYDGAELALWKACAEWNSSHHGDGSGDTTQADGVGNGGANFDISWQGNATGVGGTNDNTMSELSGQSGNTLAFAEGPYSNGWRVRFYSVWDWHDGPSTIPAFEEDLQGIGCHEYGHCLGLGHTDVTTATMTGTAATNGVPDRSIHPDDIAGVQDIYGVASANKPTITGINKCDDQLEITGTNFSLTNNTVWFTQAGSGGNGVAPKVFNQTSSAGGTVINVTIPANAGDGAINVQNSGSGFANLSNSWPLDLDVEGNCTSPTTSICFGDGGVAPGCTDCPCGNNSAAGGGGGCVNGSGTFCVLTAGGLASVSNDTFGLNIFGANPSTFAVMTSADNLLPNNIANPCLPGSGITNPALIDGLRCIGGSSIRHGSRATSFLGANTFAWGYPNGPAGGLAAQGGFVAGQTRHWQVFYREMDTLVCGTGQNTSNAISMVWIP